MIMASIHDFIPFGEWPVEKQDAWLKERDDRDKRKEAVMHSNIHISYDPGTPEDWGYQDG